MKPCSSIIEAMQKGQIFKRNNAWHLRFYREEMLGGEPVRKRVSVRLAPVSPEYSRAKDCKDLAEKYLTKVNRRNAQPQGGLKVSEFTDDYFLPYIGSKRRASTRRFYQVTFD